MCAVWITRDRRPLLPAQRGGVPFVNVAFLWMNLDRLDDDDAFDLLEQEDWIVSRLSRMTFLLLFRLSFVYYFMACSLARGEEVVDRSRLEGVKRIEEIYRR